MKVPFSIPELGKEEIEEIIAVVKSGWLTTGSRCIRFEKEFSEFVGVKHSIAVNSGTAALHLALEASGIRKGDKILVPTFTFTATAEVVRYLEADPILVDCDPETFCIDMSQIERALKIYSLKSQDIKAIIPVHFGGHPCDMDPILEFARTYGIKVIEDAAHAFPARYKGRLIGTIGDITCFSFYANKTITTGEGGMLCTDDDEVAERVKVMRLHGIDRDVWNRFKTGASWEYDVIAPGFKYNMPDINAAIGIHQLRKAELFRKKRAHVARRYMEELNQIKGFILPRIKCAFEEHAWHLFVILVDPDSGIDRDYFISEMTKRSIGTSVHYKPLHQMSYYKKKYNLSSDMFPNAEWIFKRCVSIPIYSSMNEEQVEYVIKSIKEIFQ